MGSSGDGVVAGDFDFLVYFRLGLGLTRLDSPSDGASVGLSNGSCWYIVGTVVET